MTLFPSDPPLTYRHVATGIPSLDAFLDGGFIEGRINIIDFDTELVQVFRQGLVEQFLAIPGAQLVGMGEDGLDPLREALKVRTAHALLVVEPYVGKLDADQVGLDAAIRWVQKQDLLTPKLASALRAPLVKGEPGARATVVLIASSLPKAMKFYAYVRVAAEMTDGNLVFRMRKNAAYGSQGHMLPPGANEVPGDDVLDLLPTGVEESA